MSVWQSVLPSYVNDSMVKYKTLEIIAFSLTALQITAVVTKLQTKKQYYSVMKFSLALNAAKSIKMTVLFTVKQKLFHYLVI